MLLSEKSYIEYDICDIYDKKNIELIKKVFNMDKGNNTDNSYCKDNINIIEILFNYIRKLRYVQRPNYNYILDLLL